ncbi:MAG: PEP-CTERM sorting domain-containing protein [Gemmatales bacterium]
MRRIVLALAVMALTAIPASASIISTVLSTPLLTPDNPGGGNSDGTGVWFNPLTGYAEIRGFAFPSPLFEDGKFFLLRDASFSTPEAEIFTQGFFSRGNGVLTASSVNLNPARFGTGVAIGPGVGFYAGASAFSDLGPTFGNWTAGGRGFLGLVIRDASGANATDVFYGFADITVNPDFSVTLNAFAYNNVRGAPITTFIAAVPEPSTIALVVGGAGVAGFFAWRRKRAERLLMNSR